MPLLLHFPITLTLLNCFGINSEKYCTYTYTLDCFWIASVISSARRVFLDIFLANMGVGGCQNGFLSFMPPPSVIHPLPLEGIFRGGLVGRGGGGGCIKCGSRNIQHVMRSFPAKKGLENCQKSFRDGETTVKTKFALERGRMGESKIVQNRCFSWETAWQLKIWKVQNYSREILLSLRRLLGFITSNDVLSL